MTETLIIGNRLDFTIEQGSDWTKVLTLVNQNTALPIDLTGYTARLKAKVSYAKDAAIIDLTTENGGITIDSEKGTLTLNMNNLQTAALGFTRLVYDLELVSPRNYVRKLMKGIITLELEATR